nr:hypothetical protein [Tanacetum cinerariifolium]
METLPTKGISTLFIDPRSPASPSSSHKPMVLDVPELVSKPDEADVAKVTEEEAALYTRSWPYLIELVTSKDEYVSFLLAVQAPLDADSKHMMNLKMNGWMNETKEYHGFPRNHGRKMEFPLMTSIVFASLSVSRIGKLNGPLAIQMMKVSTMEENYQRWYELVT